MIVEQNVAFSDNRKSTATKVEVIFLQSALEIAQGGRIHLCDVTNSDLIF